MYRLRAVPITISRSLWCCVVSSSETATIFAGFIQVDMRVLQPLFFQYFIQVSKINSSRRFSAHLLLVFVCHGWIKCTLKYVLLFSHSLRNTAFSSFVPPGCFYFSPFWRELFFFFFFYDCHIDKKLHVRLNSYHSKTPPISSQHGCCDNMSVSVSVFIL